MRHRISILLVAVLAAVQFGVAQAAEKPIHNSQGYGFWAIGARAGGPPSSAISQIGGGGEGVFYKGLGAAIDVGYLFPTREFAAGFGTLSPGLLYQFSPHQKTVPFVTGGYTLGFRDGTINMVHFGGGATYWFSEKVGLRIEAKDYVPTGWSQYNYFLVRFGVSVR